jgi:hypothetical protein
MSLPSIAVVSATVLPPLAMPRDLPVHDERLELSLEGVKRPDHPVRFHDFFLRRLGVCEHPNCILPYHI